ncbi:MAG: amidohydrolase family protein [Halobacteriales archaeon]|nr:amidohydrolase family protein [Halobacteriales archaeon]
MAVDTVIAGGTVVTADGMFDGGVAIDGESIVAVGEESSLPEAERTVDASGKLVMPGLVDPHVHIDHVPENRAGTYEAETGAAAVGGVTSVIDFAWQGGDRRADDPEKGLLDGIEYKRSEGEAEGLVDFSVHGVLSREDPAELDDLARAVEAGVTSFKMFMSTYAVGVSNGFMNLAFEEIADLGAVALCHTEDPSVCTAMTDRLKREDKGDPEYYPQSRPDYAEAMGAADAARMATETGVKYYGVHTSCRLAAEELARFQEDGSRIRAETCTHYTALDGTIHQEKGNLPLIAPPLRTQEDIDAMFEYLRNGTLTVVSTDHSAYFREYKEVDNWWDSPFGATSLEYTLSVFHDEAVVKRGHSYPFLVEVMSTNPARTFGFPEKGTLDPGTDADVIVFDPEATYTITDDMNVSNADYTMYDGREVTGRVEHTFVRGEQVVEDTEVVGEPGHGQFIERELPDWD